MGILHGIAPFFTNIHLLQIECIVNLVFLHVITPINVVLWMPLHIGWINLHSYSIKDLKDLEESIEKEEDTEVDEVA
jgi:hypothetical protein